MKVVVSEWIINCVGQKLVRIMPTVILLTVVLFGYTAVSDRAFDAWKLEFKTLAVGQGIRADVVDTAFRGLLPDRKVLELAAKQPEFTKAIWEYLASATTPARVTNGQAQLRAYAPLLKQLEAKYGVQSEYLLAVWGLESDFGRHTGRYNVIRSLATLTYAGAPERRAFWQKQLLSALRIVQNGDIALSNMRGSWAGAIGHTQFIPTTFEDFAVDFDGDGKRDLINSVPDALASTANYLARSGWQRDKPWGVEVHLPSNFDWSKADPNFWQPSSVWANENAVTLANGEPLTTKDNAFVLLPAGHRGPAFLAFHNFSVILKYNNAQHYALAVGYLGDLIQGKPPLPDKWPQHEQPLSQTQKAELQELLNALGYSTDGVDGKIGPNTRAALRRWQLDSGFPADGYATLEQLNMLRTHVRAN